MLIEDKIVNKVLCISQLMSKSSEFVVGNTYYVYHDRAYTSSNFDYIIGENKTEVLWPAVSDHFITIQDLRQEKLDQLGI